MEIKDKIKSEHSKIYTKHNWSHRESCICQNWKPRSELERIEKLAEKDEIKTDELGF